MPPQDEETLEVSPTVATLERMGLRRLHPTASTAAAWYFESAMHSARQVAGAAWLKVAQAAGLGSPKAIEQARELIDLSRLSTAFETVFGSESTQRLKDWGRKTTERALSKRPSSAKEQRALKLVPGRKRLGILLKAYEDSLDDMRGEPAHAWREVDAGRYWVVHYQNPYAMGRKRSENSCHFWIASYEAMLRWAGLANDWLVDEIECGCVTRTGDCVFAITSTRA